MDKDSTRTYETALTDWADGELAAAKGELTALRGEMEHLVRVIADSPVIIYRAAPEAPCPITFVSDNVRDILGYSPAEVLDDPQFLTSRMHPDDLARNGGFHPATSMDECVTNEFRVRRKDGTWAWVQDRHCMATGKGETGPELLGSMADVTAVRTEREALLKRRRMFRSIFHSAPSGIAICGNDGMFVEANAKWLELFGTSWEELRDRTPLDFVHPDDRQHCAGMARGILAGDRETYRSEQRFVRQDGTVFWVDLMTKALQGGESETDAPGGMLCIINDITQRRQAQSDLALSEEKFRNIVESSPMGVHIYRRTDEGTLLLTGANKAADEILGIDHAPLIGQPVQRSFPSDTAKAVFNKYLEIIETGEPWSTVELSVDDPQLSGCFEIHAFRVDGQTLCSQFMDVSERTKAEEALRRAEREKRAILDTITESVTFQDEDRTILWANRAVSAQSGMAPEAIIGARCDEVWGCAKGACATCPVPVCVRENKPAEAETFMGDGRTFLTKAYPFRMEGDGTAGALVVARDVTEQKRTEDEIRRARDLAQKATKMKDEFLANMSHELRSPLNGMLGMLDVILDTKLDDDQRDSIEIALAAGEGLLMIINDILDFSKLQADKITLLRNEFDLRQTLRTVVNTFKEQSARKGLDVTYTVDDNVPEILVGDEGRVRQILFNLVGNAVKFTPEGSVSAHVDILRKAANPQNARLLFTVRDTGIGIPPDQIETIFDPFVQLNWAKSRKYEGTGLGLGIVKRLVTLMGGIVTVESEVGRGTTVNFWVNVQLP